MKPAIRLPHRSLPVSRLTIALWLALLLGQFAARFSAATTLHRWTGGSATSGKLERRCELGGRRRTCGRRIPYFVDVGVNKTTNNNFAAGTTMLMNLHLARFHIVQSE